MTEKHKDYDNILQLLKSKNSDNVLLGVQLLKSTMDADLIVEFLSKESSITYLLCYPLAKCFQQQPELWEAVAPQIPSHIKSRITKWLPCTILELRKPTIATFCVLANQKIKTYYPDFPKLRPQILTEYEDYGYGSVEEGTAVIDGIGWMLKIEKEYKGPAETCEEEEWTATAKHPDFSIRIKLLVDAIFPKIWLEKLEDKKD